MAGRQHDAADAVIVADGKGEHGDRPQLIGEADSQAIADKNSRRQLGKFTWTVAGIIGDGDPLLAGL